jgi:hypothetical protein
MRNVMLLFFASGAVQLALGGAVIGLPAEDATKLLESLLYLMILAAAAYLVGTFARGGGPWLLR